MTTRELKEKYLKFFEGKGHKVISGSSLIPENDPTALFISAGMHPLVPYLLGEKHPAGRRLANVQKSIRTSDINEVGDDVHLTFFEMLGNWGLGSYWKKEAIEMSWEFLTDKKWLGLDKDKISVSVFKGEEGIPRDEESAKIWQSCGIPKDRIKFLGRDENFWGPAGKTGPCGPCTEMFYWADPSTSPGPTLVFNPQDQRWVEIWNDVFMEYNKTAEGKYKPLKQKNVDTGMGVERTVAILSDAASVYESSESLMGIIKKIEELSNKQYSYPDLKRRASSGSTHKMFIPNMENGGGRSYDREIRIIADHLRAATFILGDEKGIVPSNVERGYVLRRLIRRAIRYGKKLGIEKPFTHKIAEVVIKLMGNDYPELEKNKDFIIEQLIQEEERFNKTLEKGLKEFEKLSHKDISGYDAFILFTTYGFPIEMTEELAKEKGIKIDREKFEEEFKKHQELSRTATVGKFKSGLADNSEQVTKLHTATHLLLSALRQVLGDHVFQKGSNITAERLRLDFSHSEKLTPEQLKKVEDIVNQKIKENLPVECIEISLEEAKRSGAMGVFEKKYSEKVKVYSIIGFSREICSGPHVKSTGELGHFKIIKEEASSAGVRRIKAILV